MFKFALVILVVISLSGEHSVTCQKGNSRRGIWDRRFRSTTAATTTTTTVPPTQNLTENQIITPENEIPVEQKSLQNLQEIPANLLIQFARESNLTAFFLKYVENTRIVKDNVTLEEYLASSNGEPILDGNLEKLVVGHGKSVATSEQSKPPTSPIGRKIGRAGSRPTTSDNNNGTSAIIYPPNYHRQHSNLMCYPENKFVPVTLPNLDPNHLLLPKCVSIQQCGGCCTSESLVCEPTQVEDVVYQISKLAFNFGTSHFQHVEQVPYSIKRHTQCSCNCKVKAEDCKSEHHLYSQATCSCECQNSVNRTNCGMDNSRVWDDEQCACRCLAKNKLCSSGFTYDHHVTCGCMPVST